MKERRREKRTIFYARPMLPRNVNLPPTLIKGEYNGFNGGIVFPEQEPEKQSKLMKYPFVTTQTVNEKLPEQDPSLADWGYESVRVLTEQALKKGGKGGDTSDISDFAKAVKAANSFDTMTNRGRVPT